LQTTIRWNTICSLRLPILIQIVAHSHPDCRATSRRASVTTSVRDVEQGRAPTSTRLASSNLVLAEVPACGFVVKPEVSAAAGANGAGPIAAAQSAKTPNAGA